MFHLYTNLLHYYCIFWMTFCHLMHVWNDNDIDAVAKTAVFFKTSKIKLIKAVWQGSHCCSPLLPDQHAHTHFRLGVHVSPGTGIWGYKLKFAGTPFGRSIESPQNTPNHPKTPKTTPNHHKTPQKHPHLRKKHTLLPTLNHFLLCFTFI